MRALITGIGGFVGPYLKRELEKRNYEVYGVDNKRGDGIFSCDLTNFNSISKIISKVKPDSIFHLAGFSSVSKSFNQRDLCFDVNVGGTKNLLDSVIKAKINPKILVISSAEVYGIPKKVPINETHSLKPLSPYGESRLEQEKICLEYFHKNNLNIIILRSFPHTGPGQRSDFVCSSFAKQLAEIEVGKRKLLFVGNLDSRRDFIDVRDVVKAYALSLERCKIGEIYNVCSGKEISIKEILDVLISFSNKKIQVKQDPKRMRPTDIPLLLGDNSKFNKCTNWIPLISLGQSLKDTLNYWRGII